MVIILFTSSLILLALATYLTINREIINEEENHIENIKLENITILIPIKNEEKNLTPLLDSLNKYVTIKVLFIDDNSTDDSYDIMLDASDNSENIDVLKVEKNETINLAPRQTVLNYGYTKIETEYVSIMDADIIVNEDWQNRLLYNLNKKEELDFIYGYTFINPKTISGKIESIELFFLFSVAFGINNLKYKGHKLPSSCMGNNMTFKLKTFLDYGGYETTGFSFNDDQATLEMFEKNKAKICGDHKLKLETAELGNITESINQKLRWAIEGIKYNKFYILTISLLVLFSFYLFISSIITKILFTVIFSIYISIFTKFFNEKNRFEKIILLNLYIYVAPILYILKFLFVKYKKEKIIWKGNDV